MSSNWAAVTYAIMGKLEFAYELMAFGVQQRGSKSQFSRKTNLHFTHTYVQTDRWTHTQAIWYTDTKVLHCMRDKGGFVWVVFGSCVNAVWGLCDSVSPVNGSASGHAAGKATDPCLPEVGDVGEVGSHHSQRVWRVHEEAILTKYHAAILWR